jgi:lipopolysaccharide transport system permease protein
MLHCRAMLASRAGSLWSYRDLLRNMVSRDLRVKYKGSTLGIAWSLLHPLLIAAVYTLAFRYIVGIRIEHFPVFLLSGLLPWIFLSSALSAATGSVADNGALVRKVAFPRAILPLGAVASQFVQFLLMYLMVVPAALLLGVGISGAVLGLLPLVALQLLFVGGLGLTLATAYVFFRDTRHLLDVFLQMWFWLTPIVYPITLVPEALRPWFHLNPMAHFATSYQGIIVHHQVPAPSVMIALALMSGASIVVGLAVFARYERSFAELV